MLRLIFVFGIILTGIVYSLHAPFYMLLFYLWNAYFRPEFWVWTDLISPLRLSFVIGGGVVFVSFFKLNEFRLTGRTLLILLFLLQSLISTIASEHPEWSWPYWYEFLKVIIITLLITFLVADRDKYRLTLMVIAFSLGLESVKQGWAQLVLNPGATNNNPHPVLGDNNGVAIGMMMLTPIFVALAQTAKNIREKWAHRFAIVGAVYRGVSTYSRGGFLTAGVVGAMMLWRSPKRVRALIVIVLLAGIINAVMPQRFWDRMDTITATDEERDASTRGRLYFWSVALQMSFAQPLTGVGFNGFRPSFPTYDTSGGAWGEDRAVHSAWFGVLSEMGYPGLLLFVAILASALNACRKIRRRTRNDPDGKDLHAYAVCLQTSLIAYAVGMTFLNGQYMEFYWHFIGLTVALERIVESRMPATVSSPTPVAVPVVAVPVRGAAMSLPRL